MCDVRACKSVINCHLLIFVRPWQLNCVIRYNLTDHFGRRPKNFLLAIIELLFILARAMANHLKAQDLRIFTIVELYFEFKIYSCPFHSFYALLLSLVFFKNNFVMMTIDECHFGTSKIISPLIFYIILFCYIMYII